jgi:hypothetical protein
MSLTCIEHRTPLSIAEQSFAVTTPDVLEFAAICQEHYEQIPQVARLNENPGDGIDIHNLFGRPSGLSELTGDPMIDTLSLRNVEFGEYRFSISRELARTILPASLDFILRLEGQR